MNRKGFLMRGVCGGFAGVVLGLGFGDGLSANRTKSGEHLVGDGEGVLTGESEKILRGEEFDLLLGVLGESGDHLVGNCEGVLTGESEKGFLVNAGPGEGDGEGLYWYGDTELFLDFSGDHL